MLGLIEVSAVAGAIVVTAFGAMIGLDEGGSDGLVEEDATLGFEVEEDLVGYVLGTSDKT